MPELKLNSLTVNSFNYLLDPQYYTTRLMYLFGSRKSAKTKHIALRLVKRILEDKEYNALAMRKTGGELEESIGEEIQWAINTLLVSHLFTFKGLKKGYVFTYKPTKQRIILKGISIAPSSGKPSLSGLNIAKSGWIKDVWLEEAWEFTEEDYKMIRGTVRGGLTTFMIVGNPYFQSIWCVKRAMNLLTPSLTELKEFGEQWGYFKAREGGYLESIVHWSNLFINTKLSKEDLEERLEELRTNPKDAIVTVYGYPGSPSGTILGDLTDRVQERSLKYFMERPTEYTGGVDVGLENDATGAIFGGLTPWGESIWAEGYFHSNGLQEANTYSDEGIWRKKNPHEIAADVIEYFMTWEPIWRKRHPNNFRVSVDNADSAFISILNRDVENRGITGIKFIATKGVKEDKKRIERRIIFERQILSRKLVSFLVMRDKDGEVVSYPTRLMYEMNNIPYKRIKASGEVKIERDGSKVHPDMTNTWEYAIRRWMAKIMKTFRK